MLINERIAKNHQVMFEVLRDGQVKGWSQRNRLILSFAIGLTLDTLIDFAYRPRLIGFLQQKMHYASVSGKLLKKLILTLYVNITSTTLKTKKISF